MAVGLLLKEALALASGSDGHPPLPENDESRLPQIDWNSKQEQLNPDVFIVKTKFDPALHLKTEYRARNRADRKRFTEKHRRYATAQQSKTCESREAFREKLRRQLKTGQKTRADRYTQLDPHLFDG